ncbi:MAG: hypothetical protein KAY37_17300 [Phycisphaerae bacterium]|nr:hypothetical protein [Phycisphaerae bacterium]
MDNGFLYLLAVLCLVMLSVSMPRRSQQRRATTRDLTREQLARLRDQRGVQHSMEEVLLQLEDVSRRINAQVDTEFMKLETVIRDADDRIARLEQLTGVTPRENGPRTVPQTNAQAAARSRIDSEPPRLQVTTMGHPAGGADVPARQSRARRPAPP